MRIEIIDRGVLHYSDFLLLQHGLFHAALTQKRDFLLLCRHQPVYTLGREAVLNEFLASLDTLGVPVYNVRRGGRITFHDQGQLMVYPVVNIRNVFNRSLQRYLQGFKESIAAAWTDIVGVAVDKQPDGIWMAKKKIVFMGVGFQQWISLHGFSILIDSDISYFAKIRPCGSLIDVGNIKEFVKIGCDIEYINNRVKQNIISNISKI